MRRRLAVIMILLSLETNPSAVDPPVLFQTWSLQQQNWRSEESCAPSNPYGPYYGAPISR